MKTLETVKTKRNHGFANMDYDYFQPLLKWVGVLNSGIAWMLWLDNLEKTLMSCQTCLQGNDCVTRAPLCLLIWSWVALSFKVCEWVCPWGIGDNRPNLNFSHYIKALMPYTDPVIQYHQVPTTICTERDKVRHHGIGDESRARALWADQWLYTRN